MSEAQKLWWYQAQSDYALFVQLRRTGVPACHLLHYLQMATEKLSKAYFWRSGHAPPKSHTGFVRFLKALLDRRDSELEWISKTLGFPRASDLCKWVFHVQLLAYSLQNIAPAEAKNGPNSEYPWPHEAPAFCPARHDFDLWSQLLYTGQGRKMMDLIERAIKRFDAIA